MWHFVIASGPSLARADCDAIRGIGPAIAVNNAAVFAPWADIHYAADSPWWSTYGPKFQWYKGKRLSMGYSGNGVQRWRPSGWARTGGNGGHHMVQYWAEHGAKRIGLLGFDHSLTGGRTHFFGDHPHNEKVRLGNAQNWRHWLKAMNETAKDLRRMNIDVVNLSRETALTCFRRMTVEDFVAQYAQRID